MKCEDVMTRNPTTCEPTACVQAAALIMSEEDVGIVPVVFPDTKWLVGVVTDRDLCLDVIAAGKNPKDMHVSDSLHRDPVTCRPDDDINVCMERMKARQVHRIPIVDDNGMCVGIISQRDLALHLQQAEQIYETIREISKSHEAAA